MVKLSLMFSVFHQCRKFVWRSNLWLRLVLHPVETVHQECPIIYGKGPQPLLWDGLQAACAKITVSVIPKHPNYCEIFLWYKYTIYYCGCGPCDTTLWAVCWAPLLCMFES